MKKKRSTIKNYFQENYLFTRRVVIATALMLILIGLLIGRLFYLQILQHRLYTTLSQKNQLNLIPVDPNRGLIYDRNGVLLAENIPVYSLDIIPERMHNFDNTLSELQKIIAISEDDLAQYQKSLKQHRPFDRVPLKLKLTDEEVARFYLDQYRYPGVVVTARLMRYYPLGNTVVSAIGYVARINEQELKQVDETNYAASNYIGKTGVENFYEDRLHGTVGYQQVETDANGRAVRTVKYIPPIKGEDLYVTLDSKLQMVAEAALGEDQGAVVAIDPSNGQVLALVSNPRYDPNVFVRGITNKEFATLQEDPERPLYNRAIRGLYPPGSTVKPYLALQGLETDAITPSFKIFDPGYFVLPGNSHVYKDWVYPKTHKGHGSVDVTKAIIVSCDVFFYNTALRLGIDRLSDVLFKFGYGNKTGIDITEELGGVVPTPSWKRGAKGDGWYSGDTVNVGIGQGFMLVTPLQQAFAASIMANHGVGFHPTLLLKSKMPDGSFADHKPTPIKPVVLQHPEYWQLVSDAMQGVVRNGSGTAYKYGRNPPYTVAAKTGTAQISRPKKYDDMENHEIPAKYLSNSLFIAYAPVENPRIAVGVIVEHHPGQAVVVAKEVIDYYLLGEMPAQEGDAANTATTQPTAGTTVPPTTPPAAITPIPAKPIIKLPEPILKRPL